MNIVNDILVNTLFPDTDFVQTLDMDSVVPKYVENQEKGNPSVCKNCAEAPFRDLHIYGRSEQVTTTGAQLLDASLFKNTSSVSVKCNGSDIIITALEDGAYRQTSSVPIGFLKEGDQICLAAEAFPEDNDVIIRDTNNVTIADVTLSNGLQKTITIPANGTYYIILCINKNVSVKAGTVGAFSKLIVNKGNVSKDYEPYTGGKPSPSPEYPQEIVSAGGDGSLNVMVRGKNLLGGRFYYANYANDVLKIDGNRKENEVKLPFAPTYETFGVCKAIKCRKGKTYIISVTNPNKNAVVGMAEYETIEKAIDTNNALGFVGMSYNALKKSYIAKSDGILVCGIAGKWTDGSTTTHECTESELLQVEEASEATSYEPYHEPQSMSVTTPNGLPGIHVTFGGNYTDETGKQWICDEVDFGRGVYVRNIGTCVIDATVIAFKRNNGGYWNLPTNSLPDIAKSSEATVKYPIFPSKYFSKITFSANQVYNMLFTKDEYIKDLFDTDEALNAFCKERYDAGDPVVFYYARNPIETPLTASEIAAYKSLRTYRGTTIVEAEDKAGISVKYNMPMPELSKNGALRRWFKRHPII